MQKLCRITVPGLSVRRSAIRHSRCIEYELTWRPRVTPGPHSYYAVSYYDV